MGNSRPNDGIVGKDEGENDKGMKVHTNKLGRRREHVGQAVSDDRSSWIKKAWTPSRGGGEMRMSKIKECEGYGKIAEVKSEGQACFFGHVKWGARVA